VGYGLELTDPARDGLRELDLWLQEETLDELDALAATPPPRRRRVGGFIHDFVRSHEGSIYYVFVTAYRDDSNQVLRIDSIGRFVRREG